MKYGFFDDVNKEYVINTPKTPYPWINYLGSEEFFGLISNTGGGYCFYKDARLRRITRYRYNNIPLDQGGRYYYIKDNNDVWSPTWMPVRKQLDSYECRHGLGYTKITGKKNGIKGEILYFVPLGFTGEVHQVTLKNESDNKKSISLFSFVEFCLWDANDDMTNFQRNLSTGEVEIDNSTIYHITEYRERRNHYSFYSVNYPISAFDTDRDIFLGMYNNLDSPDAVNAGKLNNSVASGWSPIGSHQIDITLEANEEKTFIFILGYVENDKKNKYSEDGKINKEIALQMQQKYKDPIDVKLGMRELALYWESLLNKYQLKIKDERLSRMVNIWNPYQCMVTFNMSRSASYFESGIGRGMGFRDSNQDLIGFVHQVPGRARERIIDIASTQFRDGSAYHQYQPLTKKGNNDIGGGFNDDPLWLIFGVIAYIKETGDLSILDEQVPYNSNPEDVGSLFEHLQASFNYTINNLGPHGLPLIGRADWNDCLNLNCFSEEPGESFQTFGDPHGEVAESVFIAGMFVYIGKEFVNLCRFIGKEDIADKMEKHIHKMEETVIKYGYDGEWFLRAYDAFGGKIGSKENKEGKIYIEPQGFCVMAGIGVKEGLAKKALDSVKEILDTKYGIVLLQPAYTKYDSKLGEITSYPPGYKENAGIFCHNNPWIACAETVIGRGDRAFEIYKKIAPAYLEEISDIHKTEPYVYSQMIAGKDAKYHGQAKNSWLTGTAAWNYVLISQWILGIQPDYDGIIINPCIPKDWDEYTVERSFRKDNYIITVKNPYKINKGVKEIVMDEKTIKGNKIPYIGDGRTHNVIVLLG